MNKKGFTLMELLLVVAILAIVAAAAAPTFTSGAADALNEARKSGFYGAYQNTVTGVHLLVALAASQGKEIANHEDLDLEAANVYTGHALPYYSPQNTRQFKTKKGTACYLTAGIASNTVTIYAKKVDGGDKITGSEVKMTSTEKDNSTLLSEAWEKINAQ